MNRASELSKEISSARQGRVQSVATHGIVLGALYALAWVLRVTDESPVECARKKLDGK